MDIAKIALFKSYAVIYLAIGVVIYEVLFVFYSYPNDNTETATFDRSIHASYCWLCSITVARAHDWLKHGFGNTKSI